MERERANSKDRQVTKLKQQLAQVENQKECIVRNLQAETLRLRQQVECLEAELTTVEVGEGGRGAGSSADHLSNLDSNVCKNDNVDISEGSADTTGTMGTTGTTTSTLPSTATSTTAAGTNTSINGGIAKKGVSPISKQGTNAPIESSLEKRKSHFYVQYFILKCPSVVLIQNVELRIERERSRMLLRERQKHMAESRQKDEEIRRLRSRVNEEKSSRVGGGVRSFPNDEEQQSIEDVPLPEPVSTLR